MASDPQADEYRRRAAHLKRLATQLEGVQLAEVEAWAGPDTWTSPGADECRSLLVRDRQRLAHAVEDLRLQAWTLERRAEAVDAAAAAQLLAQAR